MTEFVVSLPGGACFSADADDNLLAAAQRAHWLVRYGCRNGNCEACAATLLNGRVIQREQIVEADSVDRDQPNILLCLCRPLSDLSIELPGNPQHGSSEQARRYYARLISARLLSCEPIGASAQQRDRWQLQIALPAGRQLPVYPGQYVLLEHNEILIRAEIDTLASSGRQLVLHSGYAPDLSAGGYINVTGPLGYCYATEQQRSLLIVSDSEQAQQAALLQSALPHARRIELAQLDRLSAATSFDAVLMCTQDQTLAAAVYDQLLQQHIAFAEFRSDRAIRYRWRVWRQDDNGNRFIVSAALSEAAARQQAAELEAGGHKQLYWAEPMMTSDSHQPIL